MNFSEIYNKDDLIRVLDEVSEGIYLTDGEGKTLFLNKAYEKISGTDRSMFLNKNMNQIVEEKLFDDSASLKVLKAKQEVTMKQKLNNGREVLITSSPIYDSEEKNYIKMVVTILRDVTALNKIQRDLVMKDKRINNLMRFLEKEGDIIYRSDIMDEVVNKAIKASEYNTTILITGETGVGKDLLAKLIHKRGIRKDKIFVDVNCSAIPPTLIESELFGYVSGAFTGASKQGKKGLFEIANNGTIFLDEIGDLAFDMQTKLLKVIQDKKIHRVGDNKDIPIDVNIISATNKDLIKMVKDGNFREDLYYRLNVIPIYIPPIRNRKEDILVLVEYFLHKLIKTYNEEKFFSEESLKVLYDYQWPGNVRELKNIVERTYILSKCKTISVDDLPKGLIKEKSLDKFKDYKDMDLYKSLEKFEKSYLKYVLSKTKNNKQAAKILNIDPSTLTRKRQKYSI